jgi:hypothetical protein
MNGRKIIGITLATGAIAAGGALAASASGQGRGTTTTIALTAKATGGTALDLGRKGVSLGDQFLEHGVLLDAAGKSAGRFQMVTQLVSGTARRGSEQSALTLYLSDGEVVVTGGHATTSRFVMPVVGGTGAHSGAAGTLTIAPGRGESEQLTLALEG